MNLKNEIDKQANLWIIKQNEGLLEHEKAEFKNWIKNKNHKKAYEENKIFISQCLELDDEFIKDIENDVMEKKAKNIFQKTKYIAASFFIACILIFSTIEINKNREPNFIKIYSSVNKKILNNVLPDKTIIDLDAKSQLRVSYFKNKRTVDLEQGRALFWVSKNKKRPFLVKSGNTLVEVLGTKFEVVKHKNYTKINVLEGLVRVNNINDKGKIKPLIQLTALESFSVNNSGKVLKYGKIFRQNIASWKNDIIEFEKTTLAQAALSFQRYSNKKIEFESYDLSQLKISGKFSTLHYQSFLDAIELIYPIKVKKEKNIIKIVKK